MKKVLSIIAVITTFAFNSAFAQNKEVPADAVMVTISLSEETKDQAKKLKALENATVFKGLSATEFRCYLNNGKGLKDLQKEVATLIPGATADLEK